MTISPLIAETTRKSEYYPPCELPEEMRFLSENRTPISRVTSEHTGRYTGTGEGVSGHRVSSKTKP